MNRPITFGHDLGLLVEREPFNGQNIFHVTKVAWCMGRASKGFLRSRRLSSNRIKIRASQG
jgi:hypothetical protein